MNYENMILMYSESIFHSGVTVKQFGSRRNYRRPNSQFVDERREPIRYGTVVPALFMDKSRADAVGNVFHMERSRRVVGIRTGSVFYVHPDTRFVHPGINE